MHIAIIGLGEVGRCYAPALRSAGFELSLCEAHPTPAAVETAEQCAVQLHHTPGSWLKGAQWVLSCVTGSQALAVVEQCVEFLSAHSAIADFTTARPEIKRLAARHSGERSIRYVDTAIMSAVSLNRVRTPLLAAGEGANELKTLIEGAGGRVTVIPGGAVGDAISLKILRSVFTKGLEALSVELLMAAEKQGIRQKLYEQLSDVDQTPLRDFLDMLVRTHVVHAARRRHEVQDAQQELAAQNIRSAVLPGVEERFRRTEDALKISRATVGENPNVDEALKWLLAYAV
jgi:3-hydroxyisobutyrate dehydrogenase